MSIEGPDTPDVLNAVRPPEPCSFGEQISSYALAELSGPEREAFETHLQSCAECVQELKWTRETLADLATVTDTAPPSSLRDKLLFSAGQSSPKPGVILDDQGIFASRPDELPWKPMFPGIELKTIYTDPKRRQKTLLIRMQPGAILPQHRHGDVEELFVISGDLRVKQTVLYAGDYCRSEPDSIHDAATSQTGCTFLVMASQQNEFLKP